MQKLILKCVFFTLLCGVSSLAYGARFASEIDLRNPQNAQTVRYFGTNADNKTGYSVAAGDINGDGYNDIVMGSYTALGGRGTTYVRFGSSTTFNTSPIDMNTSPTGLLKIFGNHTLDWSGYSVAVGNINGDAYDDIIIGAYKADPGGRTNAGEVYVIFGNSAMKNLQQIDLNSSPLGVVRIYGNNIEDNLGFSVSTGRINEDIYDDIIIGASNADPNDRTNAGITYVFFGSSTFYARGIIDLHATPQPAGTAKIYGEMSGDMLGYSVTSGDMNGDGYEEVIMGAYGSYGGKGGTYIIHGSADIDTCTVIDILQAPLGLVRIFGEYDNDHSGATVATGNMNGDSYKDVIMGAPGANSVNVIFGNANFHNTGAFFLNTVTDKVKVFGKLSSDLLGLAVAAGDLNGDGYDELIVGAPLASPLDRYNAGSTYVIYGSATFQSRGTIDFNGTPAGTTAISGANIQDNSGIALCTGDVDHDGVKDLIVGVQNSDPLDRVDAGEVYLIRGFAATSVINTIPAYGTYASKNSSIKLYLNSDLSELDVSVVSSLTGVVNGSFSWAVNSALFTPTNPLPSGSQITVTATGKNIDNEAITPKVYTFTVKTDEIPPRFISHSPEKQETNVHPNAPIVVKFSSDVKPDSTRFDIRGASQRVIAMTKSWTDTTLTLSNNNLFHLNETITAAISAGDMYGDRADSIWTFTVRPEITPPNYTLRLPGVPQHLPKNAYIQLIFPRDIDKSTVETTLNGSVSGTIQGAWAWNDTLYTFNPSRNYVPGETIILTVKGDDVHKNSISTTNTFTVKPDEIPPSILSHSPAPNELNVSPTANIVIQFSGDINRDSTYVTVTSPSQGYKTFSGSWTDYTLTLYNLSYLLNDVITVNVNAGDSYANRQAYSWSFYIRGDTTPPYFGVKVPGGNITMIGTQDPITLVFPVDVDKSRVTTSLKGSLNEDISGTWEWFDTYYIFRPTSGYPLGWRLTLVVNATDINNNSIPETTVIFTVKQDEIPPSIKTHSPLPYTVNIPINTNMLLYFTSDVIRDSTTVSLRSDKRNPINVYKTWADSTLTLIPQTTFQQNETVTVRVSPCDKYSNRSVYEWSYSTGPQLALTFYDVTVPHGINLMGRNDPITFIFNSTINLSTVNIVIAGTKSGTVTGTWAWSDRRYTFTPTNGYIFGEALIATVNATDIYNNHIPQSTRSFTVKADDLPPSRTSR
ncbi:Ig-like domain-containing protein, partial [bacterium]|nr:Ig-like domain-containing protein [bacterium]